MAGVVKSRGVSIEVKAHSFGLQAGRYSIIGPVSSTCQARNHVSISVIERLHIIHYDKSLSWQLAAIIFFTNMADPYESCVQKLDLVGFVLAKVPCQISVDSWKRPAPRG